MNRVLKSSGLDGKMERCNLLFRRIALLESVETVYMYSIINTVYRKSYGLHSPCESLLRALSCQ